MTIIYLLIVAFSSWTFSWLAFLILIAIDSAGLASRGRKEELENRIESGEADEADIDEYLDDHGGDEDFVDEHIRNR